MRDRWLIESLGVRVVAATIALGVQTASAQSNTTIDHLIDALGSPEAQVRNQSTAQLQELGESARTALRAATLSPIPEVSTRAWALLGRLPFYLPDDPPQVKACLFDYEIDKDPGRARRIERLAGLTMPQARRALLRIARDEPSRPLRWKAAVPFITLDDEPTFTDIRRQQPAADDAAQLILAASAWRRADRLRATTLLRGAEAALNIEDYSAELTVHLVPFFKSLGLRDQARRVFQTTYHPLLDDLAELPTDPTRMNRLADFCVRCDEQLPHALDLANRAVSTQPDNPAFLNTLAEVHFQMGRAEEAVRFEQRALRLRPHDEAIEQRLERYLAAVE